MRAEITELKTARSLERGKQFWETLTSMENNPRVKRLRDFTHHRFTSRLGHSHNVAVYSYYLARKWNWKVNVESLAVGAILHDYYHYNRKEDGIGGYAHISQHPKTALNNAQQDFNLNEKEKNIILSHIWPVPRSARPRCREAVLVCIADKYCAYQEGVNGNVDIEKILRKKSV